MEKHRRMEEGQEPPEKNQQCSVLCQLSAIIIVAALIIATLGAAFHTNPRLFEVLQKASHRKCDGSGGPAVDHYNSTMVNSRDGCHVEYCAMFNCIDPKCGCNGVFTKPKNETEGEQEHPLDRDDDQGKAEGEEKNPTDGDHKRKDKTATEEEVGPHRQNDKNHQHDDEDHRKRGPHAHNHGDEDHHGHGHHDDELHPQPTHPQAQDDRGRRSTETKVCRDYWIVKVCKYVKNGKTEKTVKEGSISKMKNALLTSTLTSALYNSALRH